MPYEPCIHTCYMEIRTQKYDKKFIHEHGVTLPFGPRVGAD